MNLGARVQINYIDSIAAQPTVNIMWAASVILKFLVASFLERVKKTSEINFNSIFNLTQHIQNNII